MNAVPLPIAADHPAFAGHFPGMPIVPGVVLLDEALYAISAALGIALAACQIGSVKFLSPVRPGEPVRVEFAMTAAGAVRFEIVSAARRVATGSLRIGS